MCETLQTLQLRLSGGPSTGLVIKHSVSPLGGCGCARVRRNQYLATEQSRQTLITDSTSACVGQSSGFCGAHLVSSTPVAPVMVRKVVDCDGLHNTAAQVGHPLDNMSAAAASCSCTDLLMVEHGFLSRIIVRIARMHELPYTPCCVPVQMSWRQGNAGTPAARLQRPSVATGYGQDLRVQCTVQEHDSHVVSCLWISYRTHEAV